MKGDGAYTICPVCGKERGTTRTGIMASHNMWNGSKMIPCKGSLQRPKGGV